MTQRATRPHVHVTSGRRDLGLMLVVVMGAFVGAGYLNAFEALQAWTRPYEQWHVDELVVALAVSAWALAAYSWRRHRAEKAYAVRLEGAQRSLEDASQRYRSLFSYNPHVVFSLDLAGDFVEVNAAAERLSGYSAAELSTMNFVELVDPEHLEASAAMFEAVTNRNARELEVSILDKAGHRVELYVTGLPIVVDDEVVGVYGIAEDVAERNRMMHELERATAAAESANEAKSFFLANMSHEIRTPLTSLLAAREMLEDTDPDPVQRKLLNSMERAGVRLRSLIESILDFSRIEAGAIDVDQVRFDVRDTVAEVVSEAKGPASDRGLSLVTQVDATVPTTVVGDVELLVQVLSNLLENAIKFTEDGAVAVRVTVEDPDDVAAGIRFDVSDTGIGIDPEDQRVIFESFKQVDPSMTRRHEGSGLGLAICEELVTAMGGAIWVDSCPGEGSTFSFRLPLAAA